MRISKVRASLVAVTAVSLLAISACSGGGGGTDDKQDDSISAGFAECESKPNECNAGETKAGGTMTYTIEKKVTGWNMNDVDTNTFDFQLIFDALLPNAFTPKPDLKYHMNEDLLASAEQTSTSPQTIVYKIRPEAVWDDGTPFSADDFIYAWQTQNAKDCKECAAASTGGYDQMKSVTGSDGGKTVTVVYETPYTDWQQPFGPIYPAHIAKQHGDLAASWKWFNETVPTYSAGPYKISEANPDVSVTLTPNPKWYGKVKPKLDKLVYRIITDQSQTVPALQNNEVQAIYPQPQADMVNQVKGIPNVNYVLGKGLTWEHFDLNLKNKFLADKALRQAIFTAINRKDIISKTVGQFVPNAEPLNSHNYVPGQEGYKDVITPTGQGAGDVEKAKKLLTDAGYKDVGTALKTPAGEAVPPLRVKYTVGNTLRQQTCELLQSYLKPLGITVAVEPTPALGKTLSTGDYDMIIFAWVGQPAVFAGALQLWSSTSGSNYGKWENAQSDELLKKAASETDAKKAMDALNQANELMAADAYVLPLFQKPTFLAVYNQYGNIRDNATNVGPAYNVQEWGVRATVK